MNDRQLSGQKTRRAGSQIRHRRYLSITDFTRPVCCSSAACSRRSARGRSVLLRSEYILIVAVLVDAHAPVRVVVDDTLMPLRPEVFGAAWHHDPLAVGRSRVAWANNWVVLGVLVDLPFITHRSVCVPVLARLWRPKRTATRLDSSPRSPTATRTGRSTSSPTAPTPARPRTAPRARHRDRADAR